MVYWILILISISIYLVYKVYKLIKCPKGLESIPTISSIDFLKFLLGHESFEIKMNRVLGPLLDKHGVIKVWWLGSWSVIVGDPQVAKNIYTNSDVFQKKEENITNYNPHAELFFGKEQIANANGEDWKKMRKLMNPLFHQSWSIDMFSSCTRELIDNWSQTNGKLIQVHDMIQRLTLDVLGCAIFNIDFESVKNPDSVFFNQYYSISQELFDNFSYMLIPVLEKIPFFRRPRFTEKVHKYDQFIKDLVEKRKQELEMEPRSDKNDLLTMFIQASQDNGQSVLKDEEIKDNLKGFFFAGHDTTSNTLTATLYYLAKYPEIQNKLRLEILQVLNSPTVLTNPTMDQLKQMDYLNMVIKESMRIMTTGSMVDRETKTSARLTDSIYLPPKTSIIMHIWHIHHNSNYFPNPHLFDPERFRDKHSQESKNWQPFITGPRSCIGMNLSLIEQRVAMVLLLQKFEFSMECNNPDFETLRLVPAGILRPSDLKLDISIRM